MAGALRHQQAGSGNGIRQGHFIRRSLSRRGTGHDQHILPAGIVLLIVAHSFTDGRLCDFLGQFGQLPSQGNGALRALSLIHICSGQSAAVEPIWVQGTWNTVPMLTRTARRHSGSQQEGVTSRCV